MLILQVALDTVGVNAPAPMLSGVGQSGDPCLWIFAYFRHLAAAGAGWRWMFIIEGLRLSYGLFFCCPQCGSSSACGVDAAREQQAPGSKLGRGAEKAYLAAAQYAAAFKKRLW